ncbi:hypothetical protein BN1708_012737 [Verticillium longisporum]|uniref:RING-type domain-containing protein n=1 Tax=Verticillium longisporum TaxID=100787 RepID=A0A0G4LDU7_VERLO|nr:hypothetical protein BN1708_012737 [Verticillium longisporum]
MSVTMTLVEMEEDFTDLTIPADYIKFYGDPLSFVAGLDSAPTQWKGKGKAVGPSVDDEPSVTVEEEVDWTKYNPPAALHTTPNFHDDVLVHIIKTSIDRLQARNAAEHRKREEEEEQRKMSSVPTTPDSEEDAAAKEPYLPIIIPTDDPQPVSISEVQAHLDEAEKEDLENIFSHDTPVSRTPFDFDSKPKKSRKFKLAHLLKRLADRDSGTPPVRDSSKNEEPSSSSEITIKHEEPPLPPTPPEEVECVSCLDDFPQSALVKITCHSYCTPCFYRLITTACQNEQQWPPKCCLNTIPEETTLAHIPADLQKTFRRRAEEWAQPAPDRIYCSRPTCSRFIPTRRVDHATRTARCSHRSHPPTCTLCRGPAHPTAEACPSDRDAALTEALAADAGWMHCGACHALVEHREACQHMTCRCGHEFCYVCALPWQTCGCTMDSLAEKLAAAAARVEARLLREEEEEEAVRMVEEFEREERLKQELLRAEAESAEAEQRAEREAIRQSEVKDRFEKLRRQMGDLRELQDVLVGWQHDREVEVLKADGAAEEEALKERQLRERQEYDQTARDKVQVQELSFKRDYASRVAEERDVEAKYMLELQVFYEGRVEGAKMVGDAMTLFRRQMDKGWRAWSQWRDGEMAAYQARIDEERTIQEEGLCSVKARLEDRLAEQAREATRRTAAEMKWAEEVWREREAMMVELEREELDDGETGSWYSFRDAEEELPEEAEASGSGSESASAAIPA